jgi:hypothetical protein
MYNITKPTELNRQVVLPFFDILPVIARAANLKIGVGLSYIFNASRVLFSKKRWGLLPVSVGINLLGRDLRND